MSQTPLLDTVPLPQDLRALNKNQLPQVAEELRTFLLESVGKTGGHFASNLGAVELTVVLHYVYNTPDDKLVWDVGHQSYPHKILTGRRNRMDTIRQYGGLAGFPKRSESEYDAFGVGHSSTSIGAALGMAVADKLAGKNPLAVVKPCKCYISARHGHIAEHKEEDDGGQAHQDQRFIGDDLLRQRFYSQGVICRGGFFCRQANHLISVFVTGFKQLIIKMSCSSV